MQTIFRVLNILLGPMLALYFRARFASSTFAGRPADEAIGSGLAALVMLAVELALTQGPRHSAWLRRWLDPRAAFEGLWLQEVIGGGENALGVFAMDYEADSDAYTLAGRAYSRDGTRWARWSATHLFIDKRQLRVTYRFEGDLLGPLPAAQSDKSGLTVMTLRRPPALALPMAGDGEVLHVGEEKRLKFQLHRVTPALLAGLGLPFTLRDLRLDARGEEQRLVVAWLKARPAAPARASSRPNTA